MAGQIVPSGSGRGGRRRYQPMAEINVTPFVDVMLVLLIIFMVTAPLLTVAVPVDLPQAQAESIVETDEPIVISVTDTGEIFVQESPVELATLAPYVVAITGGNMDARLFVRGDRSLTYGRVMEVMGALSAAAFTQVALVAELPPQPSP